MQIFLNGSRAVFVRTMVSAKRDGCDTGWRGRNIVNWFDKYFDGDAGVAV